MFDLTRLRLLRELAHRGTMTAVAQACHLTSSAVSQQLATLEREAGVALFERIGRRVRLTAEGQRLAVHAETILQAAQAAAQDLRGADAHPVGTLDVACFSSYGKRHLLAAVVRAQTRHPGLRIVVRELESHDAIDAVREGRCQLALSFAYNLVPRAEPAGLTSRLLLEEPVMLALPQRWAGHEGPLKLQALAQEDWIVGSRQSDDSLLAERACAVAGFAPRIAHTADDYELLLHMVGHGLGVGFVPAMALDSSFALAGDARSVVVRKVAGPPLTRRIHALTRDALANSPTVRALLAELDADPN
ncbi:LysR family transcriptional regulator [Pseudomonas sp. CGJS7]|uniref:LysR family transcriptional regulator n=1 Tax=Pseudomonas sp. CGJS7 TaxID=3109348 RepID=UPI00300950D0